MSVMTALYNSYNQAEKAGLIDDYDKYKNGLVILPLFHTNIRSDGWNILEVLISPKGEALAVDFIQENNYITFPVTEESGSRTAQVAAHPLSDYMEYISKSINPAKYKNYIEEFEKWFFYNEGSKDNSALQAIHSLHQKGDILDICIDRLGVSRKLVGVEDSIIEILIETGKEGKSDKTKKIDLSKVFVTFCIETGEASVANIRVSEDKSLHNQYIDYVNHEIQKKTDQFDLCDISGEHMYCVDKHRGLLGNAKVISVSHSETYRGRFLDGKDVVRIGYVTSQKIHLMLKFFLDNPDNKQYLGQSTNALVWFSDDLFNDRSFNLTHAIGEQEEDPFADENDESEVKSNYLTADFGGEDTKRFGHSMLGLKKPLAMNENFYILILNKISNGRIALQMFRSIANSDLARNLEKWYQSANWPAFDWKNQKTFYRTPNLFEITNYLYGAENDRHEVKCENDKLVNMTLKRLIPCVVEGKNLPRDMANRMFVNTKKRESYPKRWRQAVAVACALAKKARVDLGKGGPKEVLDLKNQSRDYLYGRLIAIYEKMEQDAMTPRGGEATRKEGETKKSTFIRATNAEKMWSVYFAAPERTNKILSEKLRPYIRILKADRPGSFVYYQKQIAEIHDKIREQENFEANRNRALGDDSIFGYYAQTASFYQKKEAGNTDSNETMETQTIQENI